MAWYDEAVFYHIYPLGLTGAPKHNDYTEPVHRLRTLIPWIDHIRDIGCNALYIGPLFESVGHGYETTDYRKLDSRLGDNQDLKDFVSECHSKGIRVILDGVFNHTGRDFFAFQDICKNRENSPYRDWYCNVNFYGNTEYNDGFSYDNWGGYNLLVKLNQRNPAVRDYICDVIRFWVSEFDIDGIRLDAADVLDFDFMKALRHVANEVKPEFWLMGEVIHGDYNRWVNEGTLHSVTNYQLHKALYSGHNDHNYFEIAHTVKRLYGIGGNGPHGLKLYNFVDNHDVERIYTKLNNKAHYVPVHVLLYTLPGIPSIYYGSEFGIEGKKERFSDDSLRPAISLDDYKDAIQNNNCTKVITALGHARQKLKELSYGDYRELLLTNRQYAYARSYNAETAVITVNNDDSSYVMTVPAGNADTYIGILSGERVSQVNGNIVVNIPASSGDIWIAESEYNALFLNAEDSDPVTPILKTVVTQDARDAAVDTDADIATDTDTAVAENITDTESTADTCTDDNAVAADTSDTDTESATDATDADTVSTDDGVSTDSTAPESTDDSKEADAYARGIIAGLQEAVIARMEKNGCVTDQMKQDVYNNTYHDSLINWIKSF
ncbi:MAG: alpha-amylase family glycosyl hydrolase [Wujia sp.]